MKFAVWLRAFIDALMRTPYLRSLEQQLVDLRTDFESKLHLQVVDRIRERQDLTERLRDKAAVINDLRGRLAVAEADGLREQIAKQPRPSFPVPDFGGPVAWQDEVSRMNLEADETQQENKNAVS